MGRGTGEVTTAGMAQLVAGAVIGSNFVYILVGVVFHMVQGGQGFVKADETPQLLQTILLAGGVLTSIGSIVMRKAVLEPVLLRQAHTLGNRLRVVIVSMTIAESAAIFGLICVFMTGQLTIPVILWGCSIGVSLLHFPSRAWLESPPQSR